MYIKSLIYEDQSTGWKLEKIEFNNPLTLLVGVSGVGKTQILKALLNLKRIAFGKSLNRLLKWEIEFITSTGHHCKWIGACKKNPIGADKFALYFIDNEQLFIDNKKIINRNKDGILFENEKITVKLSQRESIIYILNEEEKIKDIYEDFRKILDDDYIDNNFWTSFDSTEIKYKLRLSKSLDAIRNSNEDIKIKLLALHENKKSEFDEMVNIFIDIFPYIEDVKIKLVSDGSYFRPSVQIKEKNVPHWIGEYKISSGMLKTLLLITELYLCADNSVILIDEFENSLGINCIDELTSSILSSERNLQFIITSHHPYIINNIGFSHWKIVTRNGSVVTATDAEKFGIGKSKHQAFTQLINLDAYTDGVTS